jgi:hypothetical protein
MIDEHEFFLDLPHREGDPSMEDQDDSGRIILKLLWTHQDYFDQKALSKALAECNYYRTIKRTWKKTVSTHTLINIYLFIYFGTSLNASVM